MRQFFISLLLKLLTPEIKNKITDEKNLTKWMADAYQSDFIRDYITKRDMDILQSLGLGVNKEKYLLLLGERVELGRFLTEAKRAYEKEKAKEKMKK